MWSLRVSRSRTEGFCRVGTELPPSPSCRVSVDYYRLASTKVTTEFAFSAVNPTTTLPLPPPPLSSTLSLMRPTTFSAEERRARNAERVRQHRLRARASCMYRPLMLEPNSLIVTSLHYSRTRPGSSSVQRPSVRCHCILYVCFELPRLLHLTQGSAVFQPLFQVFFFHLWAHALNSSSMSQAMLLHIKKICL